MYISAFSDFIYIRGRVYTFIIDELLKKTYQSNLAPIGNFDQIDIYIYICHVKRTNCREERRSGVNKTTNEREERTD